MNFPNILTLSRIPIIFGVIALLYLPYRGASTAAFLLFVIGALTDWADGHFARKQKLVSNFGKLMDALTDKVFMIGIFMALLVMGVLPLPWSLFLLLLILSREFLLTGLRMLAASSGRVLAAEKSGKYKTVVQMIAAILLLLDVVVRKDFSNYIPTFIGNSLHLCGVWLFVLSTALTVSSGINYLLKYGSLFRENNQ